MTKVVVASQASGATQVGPRRWRKQLLPFGRDFVHPKDKKRTMRFTPEFAAKLIANFNKGVRDIVPVPSKHSESWRDNHGRVVALEVEPDKGIFAVLEVDEEADNAIREKLLAGVSASFAEDYFDRESGMNIGPVLRHVALTNGPYIEGMSGFEEALALSEDEDDAPDVTFLTAVSTMPAPGGKGSPVTREEALAFLKSDGLDVEALTARAEAGDKATALVGRIRESLSVDLDENASDDAIVDAITSLDSGKADAEADAQKMSARVTSLEEAIAAAEKDRKHEAAERMVAPYVKSGKVSAAEKDTFVSLAEDSPDVAKAVLSKLSDNVLLDELGSVATEDDPAKAATQLEEDAAEVERLTKKYAPSAA